MTTGGSVIRFNMHAAPESASHTTHHTPGDVLTTSAIGAATHKLRQ
jgi:hypothetical protein